eukprot:6492154-Amphidinium_carterae.2
MVSKVVSEMVAHRESVENGKTHYALRDGVPNGISGSDIALDQLRKLALKYTSELRARHSKLNAPWGWNAEGSVITW